MSRLLLCTVALATTSFTSAKSISSLFTTLCQVEKNGTHPAVDLNSLKGTSDYNLPSKIDPEAEYIFQICDTIKFEDTVCAAGTSACEVFLKNESAREIYGLVDSIKLAWQPATEGDDLVMTMVGRTECKMNPSKETITKIFFSCDKEAPATPEPKLRQESEYGCFVEIDVPTSKVCDGPASNEYGCSNGKCVPEENGIPLESCEKICHGGGSNFDCVDMKCVESKEGPFPSEDKCKEDCTLYVCEDEKCVPGAGGKKLVECAETCPAKETLYACVDKKCEVSSSGVSKTTCEANCGTETLYKCDSSKGVCEESEKGVSKEICENLCTPPEETYKCVDEKCVEARFGVSKSTCEDSCGSSTKLYVCEEAQCKESTTGKGLTKEQCESFCGPISI